MTEEEIKQDERRKLAKWIYEDMYHEFIRWYEEDKGYVMVIPIHYINRLDAGIFPSEEKYIEATAK